MIPFYESRLSSLRSELFKAEDSKRSDHDHVRFLKNSIKDIKSKRNSEKKNTKELGIKLYEKWLELKEIRKKQDFESTTVDLKVKEFDLPNGKKEIIFFLNSKEIQDKTLSGKSMPSSELSRRKRIKTLTAKIDIFVNGKKVDTSRPANVSWPNFEADLGDQFLLFLYTMPKSIELKITLEGTEICFIPVEIPGTKVDALTSTYALAKEIVFSRNEHKARLRYDKYVEQGVIDPKNKNKFHTKTEVEQKKMEEQMKKTEEQKKKEEEKQSANQPGAVAQPQAPGVPGAAAPGPKPKVIAPVVTKETAEDKALKHIENMKKGPDIKGFLYFKSEWKGEGSHMPPAIRLLIERANALQTIDEPKTKVGKSTVIDVNDPRYKSLIKAQKENNEHLKKLIEIDSLNPLHDLQPFRHIQLINQETHFELVGLDIPILEREVVNDPALSYLIEKFSKLGAMQTYDTMLKEVKSFSGTERLQDMSAEVLERRQKFMEKIKRVQKDIKTGKNKPNINYTSIIREVGGIDAKNPFAGLIERIFAPRRKLRPRIKTQATVAISHCSEAALKVQIISGINIPVRSESIQAIEILNKQINANDPNKNRGGNQFGAQNKYPGAPNQYPGAPNQYPGAPNQYPGAPNQYPGAPNQYPGAQGSIGRDQYGRDSYGGNARGGQGTLDPYGGRPLTGDNRNRDARFATTDPYSGKFGGRDAPAYSGYGTVNNPYGGTLRGSTLNQGYGGGQLAPPGIFGGQQRQNLNQKQQQMGALEKAQMELTGINKLIQGSVFIEVRLVSSRRSMEPPQIKKTRECNGSFPDWNETLSFMLSPKNGTKFTEEELINGDDTLYFSIYDKYESEKRVIMSNKHEITVENKFLGSFSVPLLSVLQNSPKMEGHIRVDRPMNLQGYGMLPSGMLSSNIFKGDIDTDLLPTYVSVSINLDPVLELPAENEFDFYPGGEEAKLLRAGALWANTYRERKIGPPIIVKCFGENVERKSILMCRYLTSQAPPKLLIDLEDGPVEDEKFAIQTAARFVSLIPFIDDNSAIDLLTDIWCTSQEFIDFNGGDYEEHAILLCNYFNYIDGIINNGKVKSYIIMGNAVPEGYTTYVLRRNLENNHVEIWDSVRGQAYFFGGKIETRYCCY
jgi:hypothetical protein